MNIEIMIGMAVFFVAIVVNRTIMTNALKKLDNETKLKFFDIFPKRNNFSLIISLLLVFVYFVVTQAMPQYMFSLTTAYFAIFIIYLIVRFVSNFRKLKEINTPAAYIKSFAIGNGIFVFGFLVLAVSVLYFWLQFHR